MTIQIRDACADDCSFIVHANHAMARETEDKELDRDRLRAGVQSALSDPDRATYLVAELHSAPVGTLMVTREWSDWRNGFFWWIQSVYVAPEARGAGVYAAMHSAVMERARDAGDVCGVRLYVDKANARARRVYEREGMAICHYDLMEVEL